MSDQQTTTTQTPPANETPLLAGKYKTADDLYKGINELRKSMELPESKYDDASVAEAEYKSLQKLHGKVGQAKGQTTKLSVGDPTTIPEDFDIKSAAAKTGLSEEEVYKHYVEHGDLSDEQFAAIRREYPWMSRKMAGKFIEGEAAKRQVSAIAKEKSVGEALAEVGGDEGWNELKAWASENIPKGELDNFNTRLDNPSTVKSAVRELAFLRSQAGGQATPQKSPGVVNGMRNSNTGVTVQQAREWARAAARGDLDAATKFSRVPAHIVAEMKRGM